MRAGLPSAAAIDVGTTLGPETWQQAEKLLPPEILAHYKAGEYVNPIASWPMDVFPWLATIVGSGREGANV